MSSVQEPFESILNALPDPGEGAPEIPVILEDVQGGQPVVEDVDAEVPYVRVGMLRRWAGMALDDISTVLDDAQFPRPASPDGDHLGWQYSNSSACTVVEVLDSQLMGHFSNTSACTVVDVQDAGLGAVEVGGGHVSAEVPAPAFEQEDSLIHGDQASAPGVVKFDCSQRKVIGTIIGLCVFAAAVFFALGLAIEKK